MLLAMQHAAELSDSQLVTLYNKTATNFCSTCGEQKETTLSSKKINTKCNKFDLNNLEADVF